MQPSRAKPDLTAGDFMIALGRLAALVITILQWFSRRVVRSSIGVALGACCMPMSMPFQPLSRSPAPSLGAALVVTRDGWLSPMFMAAVVVPDTAFAAAAMYHRECSRRLLLAGNR